MIRLTVHHFGGAEIVTDRAAMDRILDERFGASANEYWLSAGERFPCLAIVVRDARACVHYFPHYGHPGFVSRAPSNEMIDLSGMKTFFTNTPTEEIQVPAESVIDFELACQAVHEFARSSSRPTCIQWIEL